MPLTPPARLLPPVWDLGRLRQERDRLDQSCRRAALFYIISSHSKKGASRIRPYFMTSEHRSPIPVVPRAVLFAVPAAVRRCCTRPARMFFADLLLAAVLPPTDESTMAINVVGIWMKSTPPSRVHAAHRRADHVAARRRRARRVAFLVGLLDGIIRDFAEVLQRFCRFTWFARICPQEH